MANLKKLQRERSEKIAKMRSIIVKADEEKRDLTDEEINEFNGLDEEAKRMQESIDREIRLIELESNTRDLSNINFDNNSGNDDDNQRNNDQQNENRFENVMEFLHLVASDRNNERLRPFQQRATAQKMGVGALGGFALPEQFSNTILSVRPQMSIIRPGATVLAAGEPPDAKIRIPALDQGAAENMYGGIQVVHSGESLTITQTDMRLRQITLEPKALKGYMVVSNELMNNWAAGATFFETQMRLAVVGAEDYDFYRATGANSATGILNSACRIDYSRATASTITYADVVGMFARAKLGGSLVWVASQTTIPQLANIRDTGNNNLWIQNARDGIPSSMFGFPVIFYDRCPALGTRGDLALIDRSYYVIKDGSGPYVDMSTEFKFDTDETCFRTTWHVDGAAWLREPIPLEGSTSNTVSPFVILE